jgi:hypothetical protein
MPAEIRSMVSTIFTLGLDTGDHSRGWNAEGFAQAKEDIESGGLLVSLKETDISPVHARARGQLFLRERSLLAQLL